MSAIKYFFINFCYTEKLITNRFLSNFPLKFSWSLVYGETFGKHTWTRRLTVILFEIFWWQIDKQTNRGENIVVTLSFTPGNWRSSMIHLQATEDRPRAWRARVVWRSSTGVKLRVTISFYVHASIYIKVCIRGVHQIGLDSYNPTIG